MSGPVFILGGYQTDFAVNCTRQDGSIYSLMNEAILGALDYVGVKAASVDVGHVGNFVGELFTGQGMLGGFYGHIHEDLAGVPVTRHEGACASGSLAVLAAMADIESGRYDLACVTGVELMRNVSGKTASDYLGAAAWVGQEATGAEYIWPAMFSTLAERYHERYGLKREHLRAISQKNFANAKRNPNAQTRNWTFEDQSFSENDDLNPVVEGWMRRHDCSQITDGAVTVFLASEKFASDYCRANKISLDQLARIRGWGHTVAPMKLDAKLKDSADKEYMLPWTRKAILDAYARAGISGPDQLDLIETHDCFTISEYVALEHFGVTAPGEAWKAVEEDRIGFNGDIPVNPSGGLIGLGHPVGATGVRMVLDNARQVTNSAGDYQVGGATTAGLFNVGGSATTNCAFVIGSGE